MYTGNWQLKTIKKANAILRMHASGMTQREIAELLGMNRISVSLLECKIKQYPELIEEDLREVVKNNGHKKGN